MSRYAVVAALVIASAVLTSCGSQPAAPTTITVKGDMMTTGYNTTAGSSCTGYSAFSDLNAGAPVTVYDATGKVVALGKLDDGRTTNVISCTFPFTVDGVPAGDFYSVEVSHRGKVQVAAADARSGNVHLTLSAPR